MKRSIDLAAVIRARGIELKPQGHDLVGLCPFHSDKNPSLHVTTAKGLWRCVSCQATGNVIQFVQKFDGVSFRHAYELLKNGAAFTGAPTCAPVKKGTVPRLASPLAADADDQAALRQVLDYYHARLKENPAALAYLKKRGIGAEAVAAFKLGFVDRTLGLRLPQANRKEGAAIRERLTRLGVLRDTGHEHLRGRVVFPVVAESGEIGTVYGRSIDDGGKHDRHLFLPGPQCGVWNPAALRSAEVIVTEGIIDALTFWSAGFRHVTTGYSAKALPEADALKVAVRVRVGDAFHLDTFDLARDLDRRRFVERAAEETRLHPDLLKRDMGRLLFAVESMIAARAAQAAQAAAESAAVVLAPEEKTEALAWLQAPELIARLREAFRLAGVVGEETNTLIGYLCCVSRLLDKPLAAILQSPSAAGKTTVMDSILAFFPEESRVKYSAMTGQSLFYMGDFDLRHKILAIVEEAGAEKASYALKLLQSEQELRIASTGKNPQTGRMETQEYHVEGPVMIMLTTTAIDLDEELQNRCLTLSVDDSPEQTARIHAVQRERRTLAGLVAKAERAGLLALMKNVQRLLEPLEVLNDYAPKLTFPIHQTRNRRDHEKYLTLIDSIALLHQQQRPRRTRPVKGGKVIAYIAATLEDIALANQLAPEILGRSLDELPPQTRRLLDHVRALVRGKAPEPADAAASGGVASLPPRRSRDEATFTRRELYEFCGWSFTQLRVHLERLVEQEYLATRCGRFGSLYVYELLIDADAPAHVAHIKLIDVETLRRAPILAEAGTDLTGQNGYLAGDDGAPPSGGNAPDGSALGETSRSAGNAHQAGAGSNAA